MAEKMNTQSVSENGIMSESEYQAFKSKSVRLKFLMQLCGALAGATFLAVLTGTGGALLASPEAIAAMAAKDMVAGFAAINWPIALAMVVVGLVFTYFSCKYMFEGFTLDQDFNAKKIGKAARDANKGVEQTPAPKLFPGGPAISGEQEEKEAGKEKPWSERVAKLDDTEKSWASRMQARQAAETQAGKSA